MKNLKDQDGCHNCKFVYLYVPWDDPYHWYCNITNNRPRQGECDKTHKECFIHDEDGKNLPDEEVIKRMDAWSDWIKGKEVKPWQICDEHAKL